MNTPTIKKFNWIWAWQDDKEEAWLEEMSRQGLHLLHPGFPGWYHFAQGEPREYAYRMDFITTAVKKDEYFQLFRDAGWEHLGQMGGWQYFRKERRPGETLEIYTDNDSKISKYNRVAGLLVIFLPILVINFNNLLDRDGSPFITVLIWVYVLILAFYIYALINLFLRIRQLRKRL